MSMKDIFIMTAIFPLTRDMRNNRAHRFRLHDSRSITSYPDHHRSFVDRLLSRFFYCRISLHRGFWSVGLSDATVREIKYADFARCLFSQAAGCVLNYFGGGRWLICDIWFTDCLGLLVFFICKYK